MTSSQYIEHYNMMPSIKNGERCFVRKIDKGQNTIFLVLYKLERVNECYLTKQTLYNNKLNTKTGKYGVLGKPYFVFGIKNTTFKHSQAEEEYGLWQKKNYTKRILKQQ